MCSNFRILSAPWRHNITKFQLSVMRSLCGPKNRISISCSNFVHLWNRRSFEAINKYTFFFFFKQLAFLILGMYTVGIWILKRVANVLVRTTVPCRLDRASNIRFIREFDLRRPNSEAINRILAGRVRNTRTSLRMIFSDWPTETGLWRTCWAARSGTARREMPHARHPHNTFLPTLRSRRKMLIHLLHQENAATWYIRPQ